MRNGGLYRRESFIMRQFIVLATTIIVSAAAYGQRCDSALLLNNSWAFRVGRVKIFDQYLSPQEYKGTGYAWAATHGMYYPKTDYRVSWSVYETFRYANTVNASMSAMIMYLSAEIGFGSYYHWRPVKNLTLQAGGAIEAAGGVKYQSRNVNNPGSGDIALTLLAVAKVRYDIPLRPLTISLQYDVSTPVIGCMFIPEWGQSYFEIYEHMKESLPDVVKLSSFHNKTGADGHFKIDLIFSGFTLRAGLVHENRWWHGNGLHFYSNNIFGEIGTVVDLQMLCGRKALKRSPVLL